MKLPKEHARIAVNTMRARLTILGFNLAIITFQIGNTRSLGGGTPIPGFETTVNMSAGVVLLTGVALSIAAVVVFLASSVPDRDGTCDGRMLLAGDLLMYIALSQTVSGFFGPYARFFEVLETSAGSGSAAVASFHSGLLMLGAVVWMMVTYAGPITSLARSYLGWPSKLLHIAGYIGVLIGISRLCWAAQQAEEQIDASFEPLAAWLNAFFSPLYW